MVRSDFVSYFVRFTVTGAMSGNSSPSSVRLIDSYVNESGPLGVKMFVAVISAPSADRPLQVMIHLLPSRDQLPSPIPPPANTHDRIAPVAGSRA